MGEGADALKYRFQWTFPVELSPHDPHVLYVAANRVFRSTDEGGKLGGAQPDLTRDDKSKQASSGGPITKDNTGRGGLRHDLRLPRVAACSGVCSGQAPTMGWSISPAMAGTTWENITPPDLPEWALVSMIEPSPHDAGTAYLAATRYKLDDYAALPVQDTATMARPGSRSPAASQSTSSPGSSARTPRARSALRRHGDGALRFVRRRRAWQRMGGKLPVVPIYDMVRKDGDLVVATHGRSFWILEDVALLHQLAAGAMVTDQPRLFAPAPTPALPRFSWPEGETPGVELRLQPAHSSSASASRQLPDGRVETTLLDAGENPPAGVAVRYWLPTRPEGEITLTFLDEQGNDHPELQQQEREAGAGGRRRGRAEEDGSGSWARKAHEGAASRCRRAEERASRGAAAGGGQRGGDEPLHLGYARRTGPQGRGRYQHGLLPDRTDGAARAAIRCA